MTANVTIQLLDPGYLVGVKRIDLIIDGQFDRTMQFGESHTFLLEQGQHQVQLVLHASVVGKSNTLTVSVTDVDLFIQGKYDRLMGTIDLTTGYQQPAIAYNDKQVVYAGCGQRLVAAVIDYVLLYISNFLIGIIVGAMVGFILIHAGIDRSVINSTAVILSSIIGLTCNWLYFTLFESSKRRATFGKQLMRIQVSDDQGLAISFARANARYWSKILTFATLLLGFIICAFTPKRQAMHDYVANTFVVRS